MMLTFCLLTGCCFGVGWRCVADGEVEVEYVEVAGDPEGRQEELVPGCNMDVFPGTSSR